MKNYIYKLIAPGQFEISRFHMKKLSSGYARVQYHYCGICGGDYSTYMGFRTSYPVSLGHEFVGQVIDVSPNTDETAAKIGDFVISDFNYRCGKCRLCLERKTHLCEDNNCARYTNRGFARYADIHTSYLYTISPAENLYRACLIEPLSCIIHACNTSGVKSADKVLIMGCGSIGSLLCFYLSQHIGCADITVCDTINERASTLSTHFNAVKTSTPCKYGYDLIFECTNTQQGIAASLKACLPGNPICIVSHIYGQESSFIYEEICKKELVAYFPLRNGNKENILAAIDCVQTEWGDAYDPIIKVYDDLILAFQEKETCPFNKQVVRINV